MDSPALAANRLLAAATSFAAEQHALKLLPWSIALIAAVVVVSFRSDCGGDWRSALRLELQVSTMHHRAGFCCR